jgi:hypothetical protein
MSAEHIVNFERGEMKSSREYAMPVFKGDRKKAAAGLPLHQKTNCY